MKPGAKSQIVRRLHELAVAVEVASAEIEASKEGPPFSFSVGWGNAPHAIISIDDREVHRHEIENLVDSAIWALFESCRDGVDTGDPKAFARVMDRINAEARKRCYQTDPSGRPAP